MSTSTNLAAEFFVASQLNRMSYIVTLTLGSTKEMDLLVAHPDGRTVSIDAKGLKNKTNWPVTVNVARPTHFFALVGYADRFGDLDYQPEVFIVPSSEMKPPVLDYWANKKNPTSQTCVNYRNIRDSKTYRNAWNLLFGSTMWGTSGSATIC